MESSVPEVAKVYSNAIATSIIAPFGLNTSYIEVVNAQISNRSQVILHILSCPSSSYTIPLSRISTFVRNGCGGERRIDHRRFERLL